MHPDFLVLSSLIRRSRVGSAQVKSCISGRLKVNVWSLLESSLWDKRVQQAAPLHAVHSKAVIRRSRRRIGEANVSSCFLQFSLIVILEQTGVIQIKPPQAASVPAAGLNEPRVNDNIILLVLTTFLVTLRHIKIIIKNGRRTMFAHVHESEVTKLLTGNCRCVHTEQGIVLINEWKIIICRLCSKCQQTKCVLKQLTDIRQGYR